MIYKTTSIKRVIAKVFTDLDLQEGEHRIPDMIEWAGEALEKIGAYASFVNKVTGKDSTPILKVFNYQVKLPCDFHQMIQVSFSFSEDGPFYPMRYATGSFDSGCISNTDVSNTSINDDSYCKTTSDYTYLINSSYIKTNIEEGFIMMAYQAIPLDMEGYPMIPDDANFIEALYWYIVTKLYYPQWKQGSLRDAVYYDARRSWNYHCKQAYGIALMPNIDQLESIKNSWLRLVPELHEHSTGFSTLGERQNIYNNN